MTSPWTRQAAARAGSSVLATLLLATTSFGAEPAVELLGVTLGRALGLVPHAQPDEPL